MSLTKNTGLRIIADGSGENIFATVIKHENNGKLLVEVSAIIKGSDFSSEFMILEPLNASDKFSFLENPAALPFKGSIIDDKGNKEFIITGVVAVD